MATAQRCVVVLFALLFSIFCVAQTRQGILPRRDSTEYPARAEHEANRIGVALLTAKEVRNAFATDLKRYLVFEVSVYPEKDKALKLSRDDFALRIADKFSRPLDPATIADQTQRVAGSDRNIGVYPSAGVGVSTYPTYDPGSGRIRNQTGVYTNVGVGVGVGGTGNPPDVRDISVIQQELSDKGFPEGEFSNPVCGYLYFPPPDKKKGDLQLVWSVNGQQVLVKLRR